MIKQWCFAIWIILIAAPLSAAETVDFYGLGYLSSIDYKQSALKKSAKQQGAYGFLRYGLYHELEAAVDKTTIEYQSIAFDPEIVQYDYNFVYSNYMISAWKLSLGFHTLKSEDTTTTDGKTFYLGLNRYQPFSWNVGLDLFQSIYPDYYKASEKELQVTQFSPHFGFFFCGGKCYSETVASIIQLPPEIAGVEKEKGPKTSFRETISIHFSKWTLKGFYWGGIQQFAVRDKGFVLFNSAEKHLGGYGLSAVIPVFNTAHITVARSQEQFEDTYSQEEATASITSVTLGLSL